MTTRSTSTAGARRTRQAPAVVNVAGHERTATGVILHLSYARPPLTMNQRLNPHQRARITRELIAEVVTLARAARLSPCQRLEVQLHYAPGRRSHIDSHNLHATVKPIVDALARPVRKVRSTKHRWNGLSLVPDDTDEYVTVHTPVIHMPPEPGPRCWVAIEVLGGTDV